jgi:hypothetical protein
MAQQDASCRRLSMERKDIYLCRTRNELEMMEEAPLPHSSRTASIGGRIETHSFIQRRKARHLPPRERDLVIDILMIAI